MIHDRIYMYLSSNAYIKAHEKYITERKYYPVVFFVRPAQTGQPLF